MQHLSWLRLVTLLAALSAAGNACKKSKDDGSGPATTAEPSAAASTGGATTGPGTTGGGAGSTTAAAPTGPDSALLPKPEPSAAATPDEAAAELARKVLAGGDGALPALLAALEQSGIDVRDMDLDNRVVNTPAQPRQGMAFQAGEVVLLDRLRQQRYAFELRALAEVMTSAYQLPAEKHPERLFSWEIIKALRRHAESDVPTMRFWARFIIELGRQGPGEYDLLEPDEFVGLDGKIALDGVQLLLILLRLAGDLDVYRAPTGAATATDGGTGDATAGRRVPRLPGGWYASRPGALDRRTRTAAAPWAATAGLLLAARQGTSSGAGGTGGGSSGGGGDCNMDYAAGVATDAGAVAATEGFSQMLERLFGEAGQRWSRGMAIANVALTLLKFVVNGFLLDVQIEFSDGAGRLERTKSDSADGKTLEATATVRLNAGGSRYLNCFRIMLNAAGVDFNVGNDGPIDNAKVTWKLYRGGATGSGDIGVAQFRGDPQMRTDGAGMARITVEGKRQRRQLPEAAVAVEKPASLGIEVVLKDSSLAQDLVDAIGAFTGGAIGVAVSLLERMVPFGAERPFTVIDWAADYKVDYQHPRGVHFYGGTCERPTGQWDITISGDSSQDGFTITFGGSITANINEDYTGDVAGSMSVTAASIPIDIPPIAVSFEGDARFVPGTNPKLIIRSQHASGGAHGHAGLPGQDIQINWDYNSSLPQTMTLPVEVGSFCEGSED